MTREPKIIQSPVAVSGFKTRVKAIADLEERVAALEAIVNGTHRGIEITPPPSTDSSSGRGLTINPAVVNGAAASGIRIDIGDDGNGLAVSG